MPILWNNSRKVIFSREEVDAFRARWPGCKLRSRSYWFEFDAGGNLTDTDVPDQDDGPEALALSQDAADYLAQETLDRAGEVLPVYTVGKADPETEGLGAEAAGVKWWANPYPSGSREAYAWDLGHTAGRKAKK